MLPISRNCPVAALAMTAAAASACGSSDFLLNDVFPPYQVRSTVPDVLQARLASNPACSRISDAISNVTSVLHRHSLPLPADSVGDRSTCLSRTIDTPNGENNGPRHRATHHATRGVSGRETFHRYRPDAFARLPKIVGHRHSGSPIVRGSGYGVSHAWGHLRDPSAFIAGRNLSYMPFWAGMLTGRQYSDPQGNRI